VVRACEKLVFMGVDEGGDAAHGEAEEGPGQQTGPLGLQGEAERKSDFGLAALDGIGDAAGGLVGRENSLQGLALLFGD
jgi:hypothetical protein